MRKLISIGHPIIVALFAVMLLSACVTADNGSLAQRAADEVVEVSEEHRGLRVCLMAAGAVEVTTDLAQYKGNAELALTKLILLQNAIDKSKHVSTLWTESDMADVAILFAGVLKDAGKSRLAQILVSGPTIGNFLYVAKKAAIVTVKGQAVIRDINHMLKAVEEGDLIPGTAWDACEERMAMNRRVLMVLTGGSAGM